MALSNTELTRIAVKFREVFVEKFAFETAGLSKEQKTKMAPVVFAEAAQPFFKDLVETKVIHGFFVITHDRLEVDMRIDAQRYVLHYDPEFKEKVETVVADEAPAIKFNKFQSEDYLVVRADAALFIVKKAYEYGQSGWDRLQCEAEIGSAAFLQPELSGQAEVISRLEDAIDRAGFKITEDPDDGIKKPRWILVKKD